MPCNMQISSGQNLPAYCWGTLRARMKYTWGTWKGLRRPQLIDPPLAGDRLPALRALCALHR
jgi:hypothetical protein